VSGLNVPGAIGDARSSNRPAAKPGVDSQGIAASALRQTLVTQQEQRATRTRTVRSDAVQQVVAAAEAARRAREAARPKWVSPVRGGRLTAGFGEWGLWSSAHTGQDFAAPYGTPVHAVGDGRIIFAGYDGAYGNKIAIEHENGVVTWYAHLANFEQTSGKVEAGDMIGRVGTSGNTTGAHLHLEVRPGDGAPIPPLTWLRRHDVRI
jgi:murein DD-endopeptidase MepM/ murein hydrolase activator NlpD